ncbi:MAG: 3-phosphoglycerate dehydrogenase [Acidobacteria bacterium]|nr:3-phosphoglycerate dehydrogenase [Acidobacteriota bacterium]
MNVRVLVAADVDPSFHERASADARLGIRIQPAYAEADLAAAIGDAEVLVTRAHNQVTRRVIESALSLRIIAQGTSGLDNIDLEAAASRAITIVGIPGENANAVAELVIGHLISLTRTVGLYDRMMRSGGWSRGDCATRRELRGHRLGIVGLGRVGGRVARLAGAFGMRPKAYDPYITVETARERGAELVPTLDELVAGSDILTLHVPLTEETTRMIGAQVLDLSPHPTIVINTCRGPVLDLPAALARLDDGRIAGLALDVYDEEPPLGIAWPETPRLILTPHIAGCSAESKASIGKLLYEKLCDALFES